MEKFQKLYKEDLKIDQEIAEIEKKIGLFETKKKKLESKLENVRGRKKTSKFVGRSTNLRTMG